MFPAHVVLPAERPGAVPLLLLHGTGGDEKDLLPLGRALGQGALVAPRGAVQENGMNRFFRRFAEGRFDHDDVRRRADELDAFIGEMRAAHALEAPVAVGLSNGANIAAALLYRRPAALRGAVLLRAMLPLPEAPAAMPGLPVLMLSGSKDPIVPAAESDALARALVHAGADVTHHALPAGHRLVEADVALARDWLGRFDERQ